MQISTVSQQLALCFATFLELICGQLVFPCPFVYSDENVTRPAVQQQEFSIFFYSRLFKVQYTPTHNVCLYTDTHIEHSVTV